MDAPPHEFLLQGVVEGAGSRNETFRTPDEGVYHVSQIFAKLGIDDRTEIAALFASKPASKFV
jgi:hypothetical protein